jgi:hypothetical protein
MGELPTIETLHRLLICDAEAGKLFWRARTPDLFNATPGRTAAHACANWNSRFAGQEALTNDVAGYRQGEIFGRPHRAHRVIWAMANGQWPDAEIDHANGDRSDNRLVNLRAASRSQNQRNVSSRDGSTSDYLGVSWDKHRGKWHAKVTSDGQQIHIGRFESEEDAARAYDAAARRYHGEFARLNFPQVAA